MPRKKKTPFQPYTVYDDDGEKYLVDEPLIPPPQHHKTEKAKRVTLKIVNEITSNPSKWDLTSGYKFADSAQNAGFHRPNIHDDDTSALRRRYKRVLGILDLFK